MGNNHSTKKDETAQPTNPFVPFYEEGIQIYMSLKLSKDGLSREEDVEVLKGMYEQSKPFGTGLSIVSEAIDEQKE